jgi:hypothetical protein
LQSPNIFDVIKLNSIKGLMLTKIQEIGKYAFEKNKLINFVYAPNVERVCCGAFQDCYFLKKFYSTKLKHIESEAFYTCTGL